MSKNKQIAKIIIDNNYLDINNIQSNIDKNNLPTFVLDKIKITTGLIKNKVIKSNSDIDWLGVIDEVNILLENNNHYIYSLNNCFIISKQKNKFDPYINSVSSNFEFKKNQHANSISYIVLPVINNNGSFSFLDKDNKNIYLFNNPNDAYTVAKHQVKMAGNNNKVDYVVFPVDLNKLPNCKIDDRVKIIRDIYYGDNYSNTSIYKANSCVYDIINNIDISKYDKGDDNKFLMVNSLPGLYNEDEEDFINFNKFDNNLSINLYTKPLIKIKEKSILFNKTEIYFCKINKMIDYKHLNSVFFTIKKYIDSNILRIDLNPYRLDYLVINDNDVFNGFYIIKIRKY